MSSQLLVRQAVRSARQARAYDQVRSDFHVKLHRNVRVISSSVTRSAAAAPKLKPTPTSTPPPPSFEPAPQREQSWLTTKVKASPLLFSVFLSAARILGYGSPQQFANRRTLLLYNTLCATRADEASAFWREEYALPPTFQSWFTITNLHVWLLTVRLRALPAPHGIQHVQGLIDHFFQDVEERLRAVLQPGVLPPRSSSPKLLGTTEDGSHYPHSSFYTTPAALAPKSTFPSNKAYQEAVKLQKRSRAPEKLITRQMKILKEQWAGMGMSLDLGLVKGDAEMAAAVWRNLLGARGASGIALDHEANGSGYRRAVNLVGGLVEDVRKVDVDKEEFKDDNSGVHDFAPSENDRAVPTRGTCAKASLILCSYYFLLIVTYPRYIGYPELMVTLVSYIRREIVRLERLDDSAIMGPRRVGREGEGVQNLRWGDIENAIRR
ncbi:uncharacterized protein F5147DRAFT_49574 [Suillus discolor]|uniref:Ubiquinol-cytochrome c chaperone domain-containing protein n=1 Tax=Suillus discolor TaxID=1912936 RepID=A0A9P7FBS2_9AGAM|nr:uncharacterized protein F5147DRAFT_49574 [Suillus discolor]KAG2113532.1 hypothetical protein F5147DRAFT_49574 [Suillus discolor]